jgi:hypothetical protein
VQIEINAAQWALFIALAQNDGDFPVQRDAVAHAGRTAVKSPNGLLQQGRQRRGEFLRRFVKANDVPVVISYSLVNLRLKGVHSHVSAYFISAGLGKHLADPKESEKNCPGRGGPLTL